MSRRLRIASINVNGIRAAARNGMLEWLETADVDVMALQEVRATAAELQADPLVAEALAGRGGLEIDLPEPERRAAEGALRRMMELA